MDNLINTIADFYKEEVKAGDKAGYAEKFKQSTELFFENVKLLSKAPITIEDIEYRDGYFIFGFGSNSVVHFHIKECPGWLFAIWWDVPKDSKENNNNHIVGTFFTQYEENLDKFKPSRSEIQTDIDVYFTGDTYSCKPYKALVYINFIRKEPYLAFCRDYCGWDYNEEFHSREEAKALYDEFVEYKERQAKCTKELDDKILNFVKDKIVPLFEGARIEDQGENVYPRYTVVAPLSKTNMLYSGVTKPGCYGWFDFSDDTDTKLAEEFDSLCESCYEEAARIEVCYSIPIHDSVEFYSFTMDK